MNSYTHGKTDCTRCVALDCQMRSPGDQWQLTHWPAYWGSSTPHTLVLGFSMGATQVRAARERPFDQVSFHKRRVAVGQILDALGLPRDGQTVDDVMKFTSKGYGFSSVSRCSLGLWEKGAYRTSGAIMPTAVADPWATKVLRACAETHLAQMPASIKRVVLLGSGNGYMRGMRRLLNSVFDDLETINEAAFRAGGRTWVFTVHPAAQGNGVQDWLTQSTDTIAGRKRMFAVLAIRQSLTMEAAQTTPRPLRRQVVKRDRSIIAIQSRATEELGLV